MLEPDTPRQPDSLSAKGETVVHEPTPAERTVARRTSEARATIPDLELSLEADVERAVERCAQDGVTLDGLLVSACASALRAVPRANGAYRDGRFETYSRVNVGVVVASGDSYVIPTVFDADGLTPVELSTEVVRLSKGVRERSLTSAAFAGATFTVWNAGALGIGRAGIVINAPQAAALTAGAVRAVPVIREGELRAGRMMTLTLVCDHRILYGAAAAAFLAAVKHALEG